MRLLFNIFICGCTGSSLLGGLSSSCGEGGSCLVVVLGVLIVVASVISECRLLGMRASTVLAGGLSGSGSQVLEHRLSSRSTLDLLFLSMWDPLGPGIKPISPALAGGFFTTDPPGKPPRDES